MPIYEYSCRKCNDQFSVIHAMTASENIKCPKCGSDEVKKKISSFSSFSFGGSSFGPMRSGGGFGGG